MTYMYMYIVGKSKLLDLQVYTCIIVHDVYTWPYTCRCIYRSWFHRRMRWSIIYRKLQVQVYTWPYRCTYMYMYRSWFHRRHVPHVDRRNEYCTTCGAGNWTSFYHIHCMPAITSLPQCVLYRSSDTWSSDIQVSRYKYTHTHHTHTGISIQNKANIMASILLLPKWQHKLFFSLKLGPLLRSSGRTEDAVSK